MFRNPLSDCEVPNNLLHFQAPITRDHFQTSPNGELILVKDENTQHSFFHN